MIVDLEEDPRHAGQILRYHTWPVHRQQTVGEHSWQIMRIMLTIWPEAPKHLLCHAVTHDVGEMIGDLPYPAKKNDPLLKDRITLGELRYHRAMSVRWGLPAPTKLTDGEREFFKLCEYIEMWEYGLQEQNMGNLYGKIISVRMQLAASTLIGRMPPEIQQRARAYCDVRESQESETVPVVGEQKEQAHG